MACNQICVKFLQCFACSHLNEDFFEDEGWDMMNCLLQTKGSPISKIKELKDRGNNLYKQNCFGAAASCYDDACKLLSLVVGMEDSYDTNSLSDFAVSLNLNLAACALKLFEYEASKDHCSIVLSFFPRNVKALFRRGLAFMKLNKVLEAKSDLEAALLVEPRNKDILRELDVVKNYLAINSNGKRSMVDHALQADSTGKGGKGKVQVQEGEPPLKAVRESDNCSDSNFRVGLSSYQDNNFNFNFSGESLTSSSVIQKCDMELDTEKPVSDQQSCINSVSFSTSEASCNFDSCAMDNSLDEDENGLNRGVSHGVKRKMFQFSKKGEGHSKLKIDACTYKKLLDGKKVSFFQKSHLSILKIRVLKPCIKEPRRDSVTPHKKKRKRRKRTKSLRAGTLTTVADGTKSDVLPPSSMVFNKTFDCDLHAEKVTSSVSCELVNHQDLRVGSSGVNSHEPPFFVFTSSKLKVPKVFHAKRQSTRIQSRREESPRRNVYIYPGKFPRSRDVSVSCCRYFPKAQLPKKRKEPTSSMFHSNNLKKPRVLSNPTPSLSFCINNVVLAPDLSSPMCSM